MTTQSTAQKNPSPDQGKKGFTLTEIAIVLGIIGMILGAIWTAASSVYNNQRISHANTSILQITQGVRTLYSEAPNMGNTASQDMTASLITAGALPMDIINGTAAIGPWASSAIKVLGGSVANDVSFTIEISNVPLKACISLISSIGGASRDTGLFGIATTTAAAPITTASAGTALTSSSAQIAVVTPAIATTACSAATNTVQFGFGLKS